MKKYSILVAAFLFSCTSDIESPDSILQRLSSSAKVESSSSSVESSSSTVSSSSVESSSSAVSSSSVESSSSTVSSSSVAKGYQVLSNVDFDGGVLAPWEKRFGSLWDSPSKQGKINLVENPPYGYDAIFTPSGQEVNNWDLQLLQGGLNIKPGYSYKLEFGGNTTIGGTAPVKFVLMNCTTASDCTDYVSWSASLSLTYTDYFSDGWKNCSVTNSNATFVISGGSSTVEFKIAYAQILAEPVSCP